jgi:hypothetical protein
MIPLSPWLWRDVFRYIAGIQYDRRLLRNLSLAVIVAATGFIIIGTLLYLINMLSNKYPFFQIMIGIFVTVGAVVLVCIVFLIPVGTICYELFIDQTKYRTLMREKFTPSRSIIADRFLIFKTAFFRKRIVEWFERSALDHLDTMRLSTNSWPGGRRPQIKGDDASTRLAELDAKWLQLD